MFPSAGPTGYQSLPKKFTNDLWKFTLALSLSGQHNSCRPRPPHCWGF